jgi:hypothetical protein
LHLLKPYQEQENIRNGLKEDLTGLEKKLVVPCFLVVLNKKEPFITV